MDSEGSMLVSAHASTVYAVWRMENETGLTDCTSKLT
jgi:hypothetical protein